MKKLIGGGGGWGYMSILFQPVEVLLFLVFILQNLINSPAVVAEWAKSCFKFKWAFTQNPGSNPESLFLGF